MAKREGVLGFVEGMVALEDMGGGWLREFGSWNADGYKKAPQLNCGERWSMAVNGWSTAGNGGQGQTFWLVGIGAVGLERERG